MSTTAVMKGPAQDNPNQPDLSQDNYKTQLSETEYSYTFVHRGKLE